MSDFDFVPPVQDDPAAEFLAREQSALGDLDEDFAFTDGGETKDPQFSAQAADIKINGDFTNGDFAEPQLPTDDIVGNGLSNGISDLSLNKQEPEQPALVSQPIMPPEEPESIKKWREDHIRALAEKDADEEKKIAELKEQGKKELEEWYARYAEQLEKLKQQNRNAEKEFVAERDNEEPGQNWEKISRLCDFNPKTSRNNRDTTRMRSILLQLKTSPPPSSSSTTSSSAQVSS